VVSNTAISTTKTLCYIRSIRGRLGMVLLTAIIGMCFFAIISINEFNETKQTLNLFQTEINKKISSLSKQKKTISEKKSSLSEKKTKHI